MALHGFGYQGENSCFCRSTPNGEGEASAGAENTISFRNRFARSRKVQHTECTRHGIKACVFISKIFCICDFKFCFGEPPPGFGDHVLCYVGTSCIEAPTCGFGGHVPGPTCDVEQLDTRPSIDGGKKRIDSLSRHFANERIVVLSLFAPADPLELFKFLALSLAYRHRRPHKIRSSVCGYLRFPDVFTTHAYVRFGSLADLSRRWAHVCFTPGSRHCSPRLTIRRKTLGKSKKVRWRTQSLSNSLLTSRFDTPPAKFENNPK